MNSLRRLVVGALTLTTSLAVPAVAHTPSRQAPSLAGVNRFVGSTSATMTVELPRPAHVTIDDIHVSGAGRFLGFVMESTSGSYPRAFVQLINEGMCARPGCRGPFKNLGSGCVCVQSNDGTRQTTTDGTLPAGLYRVYFIADGATAHVRLRLPGLDGVRTLTPSGPISARIDVPAPEVAEPADGPLIYSAGTTHSLNAAGAYLAEIVWKIEPLPVEPNVITECAYKDGNPPPEDEVPDYQEPCNGSPYVLPWISGAIGTGHSTRLLPGTPAVPAYADFFTSGGIWFGTGSRPIGRYSIGIADDTAGPVLDAHYMALWIDRQEDG